MKALNNVRGKRLLSAALSLLLLLGGVQPGRARGAETDWPSAAEAAPAAEDRGAETEPGADETASDATEPGADEAYLEVPATLPASQAADASETAEFEHVPAPTFEPASGPASEPASDLPQTDAETGDEGALNSEPQSSAPPEAAPAATPPLVPSPGPSPAPSPQVAFADLPTEAQWAEIEALGEDEAAIQSLLSALSPEARQRLARHAEALGAAEEDVPELPATRVYTQAGPYLGALYVERPADIDLGRLSASAAPAQVPAAGRARRGPEDAAASTVFADGIGLGKYVSPVEGDASRRRLTLEAFTSGTVSTTQVQVPLDIVLVLDTSGSMAWNFAGSGSSNERFTAMKNAVKNFIDTVRENSDAAYPHRIAALRFASDSSTIFALSELQSPAQATALKNGIDGLAGPAGATRIDLGLDRAENIFDSAPPTPLPPGVGARGRVLVTFTDGYPTGGNGFGIGVADAAAGAAARMKSAGITLYSIGIFAGADPAQLYGASGFAQNSDGSAGSSWYRTRIWNPGNPNNTLSNANAALWSPLSLPAANRFMNIISSNVAGSSDLGLSYVYEQVSLMWHYGYRVEAPVNKHAEGYYLSADSAASLDSAFQSIAHNIATPSISLPTGATAVQDILSDQFRFPAGFDAASVSLKTYECTGKDAEGNWLFAAEANAAPDPHLQGVSLEVDAADKLIKILGYNYNTNYVTEQPKVAGGEDRGRKLVIEFEIESDPTFFGGNGVPTNSGNSGLINLDTGAPHLLFPTPRTDVALHFAFVTYNQLIYAGNQVDLVEAIAFGSPHVPYKPNGVNNAYVDIRYELLTRDNVSLGSYTIPAGTDLGAGGLGAWADGHVRPRESWNYRVRVTMSPTLPGSLQAYSPEPKTIGVVLARPKIAAEDTSLYLGESLDMGPLYTGSKNSTSPAQSPPTKLSLSWVRDASATETSNSVPLGPEPLLRFEKPLLDGSSLSYDLAAYAPEQTQRFISRLWMDNQQGLGLEAVELRPEPGAAAPAYAAAPGSDFEFFVRVETCSLQIEKRLSGAADENQSFVFEITRGAQGGQAAQTWTVVIQGAGTKRLQGLPVGHYTVRERGDWSWRYTATPEQLTQTLSAQNPQGQALFTNSRTEEEWLGGECFAVNLFDLPRP